MHVAFFENCNELLGVRDHATIFMSMTKVLEDQSDGLLPGYRQLYLPETQGLATWLRGVLLDAIDSTWRG